MPHDPTHDAETDAIVAELEQAGLIEVQVRPDGLQAYTLPEQGGRVGRMLAMAGDDADVVLDGLSSTLGEGDFSESRNEIG
jgi:hypothetical protein